MTQHLIPLSFWLVALLILPHDGVHGQGVWQGCVDPDKPKNKLRVGKRTRVCFTIANTTDWSAGVSYMRASFEPQADVYSRFHIPNCTSALCEWNAFLCSVVKLTSLFSLAYNDLVLRRDATNNAFSQSPAITVGASSQTALSFLKVYYDSVKKQVFPFLTAIIEVDKGVIQFITWDDGCVFCGATECLENTYNFDGMAQSKSTAKQITRSCVLSIQECNDLLRSNSTTTACDLTFYVVWSGTDANGIALQSQAYRFSAFPAQKWSDRISQLLIPDSAANFLNSHSSQRVLLSSAAAAAGAMAQSYAHVPLHNAETEGRDL
jgi:hypothetical protein